MIALLWLFLALFASLVAHRRQKQVWQGRSFQRRLREQAACPAPLLYSRASPNTPERCRLTIGMIRRGSAQLVHSIGDRLPALGSQELNTNLLLLLGQHDPTLEMRGYGPGSFRACRTILDPDLLTLT